MTEIERLHATACEYWELRMRIDEATTEASEEDRLKVHVDWDQLEQFDGELSERETSIEDHIMICKPVSIKDALIQISLVQMMIDDAEGTKYTKYQRETLAPRMLAEATAALARETGVNYDPDRAPYGRKGRTWEMDRDAILTMLAEIENADVEKVTSPV